MKRVKFHGKRKDNGEWAKGSYVYAHKWYGGGDAGHFITSVYGDRRVEIIPDTLGQYICIEDKNNVEIYEGDIVRFNNQIGKVVFEKGSFGIAFDDFIHWEHLKRAHRDFIILPCCCNDHFISFFEIYEICDNYDDVEVIGNIFDNPELLKEANNEKDCN